MKFEDFVQIKHSEEALVVLIGHKVLEAVPIRLLGASLRVEGCHQLDHGCDHSQHKTLILEVTLLVQNHVDVETVSASHNDSPHGNTGAEEGNHAGSEECDKGTKDEAGAEPNPVEYFEITDRLLLHERQFEGGGGETKLEDFGKHGWLVLSEHWEERFGGLNVRQARLRLSDGLQDVLALDRTQVDYLLVARK